MYNHMMDVAFSVVSDKEDPFDLSPEELLDGMEKRLQDLKEEWEKNCDLDRDGASICEAFGHCDSYEE